MKTMWTPGARNDLKELVVYIRQDRPAAARRLAQRIRSQVTEAAEFPRAGRMVPELGDESIRERIVGPYRIVYRVESRRIVILAIVHGRREMLGVGQME